MNKLSEKIIEAMKSGKKTFMHNGSIYKTPAPHGYGSEFVKKTYWNDAIKNISMDKFWIDTDGTIIPSTKNAA